MELLVACTVINMIMTIIIAISAANVERRVERDERRLDNLEESFRLLGRRL